MKTSSLTFCIGALILLITAPLASADDLGADDLGDKANVIVKAQASTIITVRMVIDLEFSGRSQEHRLQARGVVVSDTGLILTALGTVSPSFNVRNRQGKTLEAKVTPVDIKIVFENEEKEWDAFLVVKDTKRGLAFLQIKDFKPGSRKLKWVDFSSSAKAVIGDQIVTVTRLSKGYDYAPLFTVARVIGKLKKPRKGHVLDRSGAVGLPAFNLNGKLLGVHGRIKSELKEGLRPHRAGQSVILSAKEINPLIKQALKKAAEGEAEEEKDE